MRKGYGKRTRFAGYISVLIVLATMNCGCSTGTEKVQEPKSTRIEVLQVGRTQLSFVKTREQDDALIVSGVVAPRGRRTSGGHGHIDVEMYDANGAKVAERSVTYEPHHLARREQTRFRAKFDRPVPKNGKLVVRHHFGVHFSEEERDGLLEPHSSAAGINRPVEA